MTENEKKAQRLILSEINKAMDLLEGHLKQFCTNNKAQSVPMVYISTSIKILKENMAKGAERTSGKDDANNSTHTETVANG